MTQSFLYDSLVIMLVGPEKKEFSIHKSLICAQSDFLKAATMGNFKESNGIVTLPDQDISAFQYFVHWLYRGTLRDYFHPTATKTTMKELREAARTAANYSRTTKKKKSIHSLPPDSPSLQAFSLANYHDAPFSPLINLYILADFLQVPRLKDSIISLLIEVYDYYIPTNHVDPKGITLLFWCHNPATRPSDLESPVVGINTAWAALPNHSPLRKLLVLIFCNNVVELEDVPEYEELCPAFLLALAHKYASKWYYEKGSTDWSGSGKVCKFHEHGYEGGCRMPGVEVAEEDGTKLGW